MKILVITALALLACSAFAQDRSCVYGNGFTVRQISEPIVKDHKIVGCTNGGCSRAMEFGLECFDSFTQPEASKLPDDPSTILPADDGTAKCYRVVMDEHGEPVDKEIFCDSIPWAKSWRTFGGSVPRPGFWTFRKNWRYPPLRTNRQTLLSKTFLICYGSLWAVTVTDIAYTHGARETWDSEIPAISGATIFGYIADRYFTRPYMVGGALYGIQHYLRDAVK